MKHLFLFTSILLGTIGVVNAQVGIGTTTPAQKLDIKQGRMRFTGDPAPGSIAQGIEFTTRSGTGLNGFLGAYNDSIIGFYGFAGSGWSFLHNNKNGNVGIGTAIPSEKLEVNGAVKITDGTQGDGKVLTSDAAGRASWRTTAYGDKIRFCFRRDQTSQSTAGWTSIYNEGGTDADLDRFNNSDGTHWIDPGFFIFFNSPGLYHLDINATLSTNDGAFLTSDDNGDPLNIRIYLVKDNPSSPGVYEQELVTESYPSNFTTSTNTQTGVTYKWASVDKSMDIYIKAGDILQVSHSTRNRGAHLTVTGVKISD